MEKSCEKIEEILVDYTDGQLPPDKSNQVAEHLESCEHCRQILEALQKSLALSGVIWDDGLAETKEIRILIPGKIRNIPWTRYAAAAAGIILLLSASVVWQTLMKPADKEINFAEIERSITEAGTAARLLAATELLAEYPEAQSIVKKQYNYIIETYPETSAADKAKLKIQ